MDTPVPPNAQTISNTDRPLETAVPSQTSGTPQVNAPPPKPSMRPIAVLSIVAILVVSGILLVTRTTLNKQPREKASESSKPTLPEATAIPTTQPSGWKQYTNTKFQYSFNYPTNLSINFIDQVESEAEIIEITDTAQNTQMTIMVSVSTSGTDQSLYLDYKSKADGQEYSGTLPGGNNEASIIFSTTEISKNPAYRSDLKTDTDVVTNLLSEKNGLIYTLQFLGNPTESETFNQIVSTFKFLE